MKGLGQVGLAPLETAMMNDQSRRVTLQRQSLSIQQRCILLMLSGQELCSEARRQIHP